MAHCCVPKEGALPTQPYLTKGNADNTSYQCTADLLYDGFGFDQTSKYGANSPEAKNLNRNK